jgi:hypothetical protein
MFVSVKFRADDFRTYTYQYDGEDPIEPGSRAVVVTRDGPKIVHVVGVDLPAPPFECKPIESVVVDQDDGA